MYVFIHSYTQNIGEPKIHVYKLQKPLLSYAELLLYLQVQKP